MLALKSGVKVFVNLEPIDMRKAINGLSAVVLDNFAESPQSQHLFLFFNKTKNKVKILFWDKNGFVLYYKRLEKGRFRLTSQQNILEITADQLNWLLAGLDFQLMNDFSELNYRHYY